MAKISRRPPRSEDNAELGHFTLLFCRGRQRNVQRFIMHVHSYCSANLLFGDVLVAVVLVVCLSSLKLTTKRRVQLQRLVFKT